MPLNPSIAYQSKRLLLQMLGPLLSLSLTLTEAYCVAHIANKEKPLINSRIADDVFFVQDHVRHVIRSVVFRDSALSNQASLGSENLPSLRKIFCIFHFFTTITKEVENACTV